MKKFYLTVGAVFKNESSVLKEWIEHYKKHGVDHIYLINDYSTDDYFSILEPYLLENYITLFQNNISFFLGRQSAIYNKYLLPKVLEECQWIAILDIDEYLYTPIGQLDLKPLLVPYETTVAEIEVNWLLFGSNGFEKQPIDGIVKNFVKRAPSNFKIKSMTPHGYELCHTEGNKSILNTNFIINEIGVHGSKTNGPKVNLSWKSQPNYDDSTALLLINHYQLMSKEYFFSVKATRGDVNCWFSKDGRNLELFNTWDQNTIEDLRLWEQNKL